MGATTDYECNWMTDDDDGRYDGIDGSSISRSVGANMKREGSVPKIGEDSVGKACRPQHFHMHEPVVVHSLVAADDALGCDEVVRVGKRQCLQVPSRAECSKRPRKPG